MENEKSPKLANLEKILLGIEAKRKEIISFTDNPVANLLASHLDVQPATLYNLLKSEFENPYYWIRQGIRGNMKKKNSQYTSAEVATQRMSDYLHFLGYSQEESKKIFESIHEVCQYSSYVPPNKKIKPFKGKANEKTI